VGPPDEPRLRVRLLGPHGEHPGPPPMGDPAQPPLGPVTAYSKCRGCGGRSPLPSVGPRTPMPGGPSLIPSDVGPPSRAFKGDGPSTVVSAFAPRTHHGSVSPTLDLRHRSIVAIEGVVADKSSEAAGQGFEPDRPHKSLRVRGRRLKTKTLVTDLSAARASDMPSRPCGGRKSPGGFD
jgi:hypothetical protein